VLGNLAKIKLTLRRRSVVHQQLEAWRLARRKTTADTTALSFTKVVWLRSTVKLAPLHQVKFVTPLNLDEDKDRTGWSTSGLDLISGPSMLSLLKKIKSRTLANGAGVAVMGPDYMCGRLPNVQNMTSEIIRGRVEDDT